MATVRTWALVLDAVRARILRDLGHRTAPAPGELVAAASARHLRAAVDDRPGRSQSSDHSGRRSAMEPATDPIRQDMQDFARETVALLETHRRAGDFDRLAVFADPRMLGILRAELPPALQAAIFLESPVNLVPLSEPALRDRVLRLIGDHEETGGRA
jgi:protein required for attachment to host cells